jgi:acyl-CoA synthetase (AMP-forming)/AMP-acid ligase II
MTASAAAGTMLGELAARLAAAAPTHLAAALVTRAAIAAIPAAAAAATAAESAAATAATASAAAMAAVATVSRTAIAAAASPAVVAARGTMFHAFVHGGPFSPRREVCDRETTRKWLRRASFPPDGRLEGAQSAFRRSAVVTTRARILAGVPTFINVRLALRSPTLIAALLRRAAERFARAPAVEGAGGRATYAEVAASVARRAGAWRRAGLEPGDRVALLAPNSRLFLEGYFAAAHAGLVLVPLNWRSHPEGLARLLAHSEAKLLVAARRFEGIARAAAVELAKLGPVPPIRLELADEAGEAEPGEAAPMHESGPDDPAHLYYTSGTTGEPKGVVLTHRNVTAHAQLAIDALALDERDVWAHVAPMFHLADAWATFAITAVGGRHVMVPDFEPARVLDVLAAGVTITNLVPTMLGDLVSEHERESSRARDAAKGGALRLRYPGLRRLLSGGAPIAPALVKRIVAAFGCEYVQTYGLTETSPYLTMSLPTPRLAQLPRDDEERFRFACKTGRPLEGVEVRVVRDDFTDVCPDGREVGEVVARGPTVTAGYWRNPAATAAAFRDGWLLTGDLAVIDEEGFLNVVDRKKDVIKSGGESIYSTEVEQVLHAHPSVHEVAVVGVPHERWGESVIAVVVPRPGAAATEQSLLDHCRAHLGGPQVPKRILFKSALPRTGSGKIAKRLLRDELARG